LTKEYELIFLVFFGNVNYKPTKLQAC